MKKHFLGSKGLSMSQAQSISNLCHQKVIEIDQLLNSINNCSKTIKITGDNETYLLQKAVIMPENIEQLLIKKAQLCACQAFLMENIKAKETLLQEMKQKSVNLSSIKFPEKPIRPEVNLLSYVEEDYGWEQLSHNELAEFYEAEAFAAHIGQFIHKGGKLESLRKEIPTLASIGWIEIEQGKKTPIVINPHHNSEQLLALHERLAKLHGNFEQTVNYFKAKVKNLVTLTNAKIAQTNSEALNQAQNLYDAQMQKWDIEMQAIRDQIQIMQSDFEKYRNSEIATIASWRIQINSKFQSIIDEILEDLPIKGEE